MPVYSHSLRAQAHGVAFELRATSADVLAAAGPYLPFGSTVEPGPRPDTIFHLQAPGAAQGYCLRRAGKPIFRSPTAEPFFEALHTQLMISVADLCPDRVFLHAGVVAWHGRAILLPGSSHAGKTTLTAELVRAGATYYSDEYALIDSEGLIHPFPRDLQMRRPGRPEQTPLAPSELTSSPAGCEAIPAVAVLFVQYQAGSEWSPQPVTPAMAVLECLKHIPSIRRHPAKVMATLTRVLSHASALRSSRGEAPETARQILAAL